MSAPDRRAKLDRERGELSIRRQYAMLSLARSGVYRKPRPANDNDLEAMRRIDALFTARPFFGARRIARTLSEEGFPFDRKRVRRLMRRMGIEAPGPKPRTTKPAPGHKIYPYLLRDLTIDRPNQVWTADPARSSSASGSMSNTAFVRRMYATCARVAVEQAPEMTAAAPCTGGRRLASCALCSSPARRKLSGKPSATPEPPVTSVPSESAAPGVRRSSSLTASRIA
jgi:transposase InsO family protein